MLGGGWVPDTHQRHQMWARPPLFQIHLDVDSTGPVLQPPLKEFRKNIKHLLENMVVAVQGDCQIQSGLGQFKSSLIVLAAIRLLRSVSIASNPRPWTQIWLFTYGDARCGSSEDK